jgi:hypothetical protein
LRDKNLNSESFCSSVEKIISQWAQTESKTLRSNVVNNSNFHGASTFFAMKNVPLKDFIKLAIVSWYCDEEVKFVLQEDLREVSKYYSPEDRILCEQFLKSRAIMLLFLLETHLWHTREFFGFILKDLGKINRHLKVRSKSTKVKKVQRKRGYHDHGSRVLDHRWLPKSDYTLTEMQNDKEEREKSLEDTSHFIEGFIT